MDNVSQTAVFAAQVRAAHSLLDRHPIFEDPYALLLADSSEDDVRDLFSAIPDGVARVARVLPSQRARFVDEEVERAVRTGIDQYVIMGAGLDSFAWRREDLMSDLELFEVDHPATQAWKRMRAESVGLECTSNLHFVGVDFSIGQQLSDGLTAAGFDPLRPSIWSWLGVIVYLTVEAVESTFGSVVQMAAPRSRLIASYTVTKDLMDSASREFDDLARAASAEGDEPHITFMAPGDIEKIAKRAGFADVRSVDPSSFLPWFSQRTDGLRPVSYEWILVADT